MSGPSPGHAPELRATQFRSAAADNDKYEVSGWRDGELMSINYKESEQTVDEAERDESGTRHLRALIKNCTAIPSEISEAKFARVVERKIDESLLRYLTENGDPDGGDKELTPETRRRLEALSPYLDRTLICILIRLPGVNYTIEIDPTNDRIVHWEWQAA